MNAKDSGDKREWLLTHPNYVAECKIDGSRYLSIDSRLFSRRLSVKDGLPVEKSDNVPHITAELSKIPKGTILDGEIYYKGMKSTQVTSIMGSLPAKAIERQALNPIRYCLYDVLWYNGKRMINEPWHVRRSVLEHLYSGHLSDSKHIDLSSVEYGDKRAFLDKMMAQGEEGIMLKNINAPYQPDKRPEHTWYKIKKHDTADVVITGFLPGKGKYEGQVGSILFSQYDRKGGKLKRKGSVNSSTEAVRLDITKNPNKYLGKVLEISYMEKTKDGKFRHPQWSYLRTDKAAEDCTEQTVD